MAGTRYAVGQEDFHGHVISVLTDLEGGREARILPSVGNNCYSFRVEKGQESLELLHVPPDPETLAGRPSGYGVPILFPWPNRIEHGIFSFDGVKCELDTPSPGSHASHGFVHGRPWVLEESGASNDSGAWVRSRIRSEDFPEIGRQFPYPFESVVTYRLIDGTLNLEFEGFNTGKRDMPVGVGFHPYFPLPIQEDGTRDSCSVKLPAHSYWPLGEEPIPTGEILTVQDTPYDVRNQTSLSNQYFDHVWTGVERSEGWSGCDYLDALAKMLIVMEEF